MVVWRKKELKAATVQMMKVTTVKFAMMINNGV
jgi:hypothetical protein